MQWVITYDVVAGDTILFTETVWSQYRPSSRWRRRACAEPVGQRSITAEVLRESYGANKQQHTFTLRVIDCQGDDPIPPGEIIHRKGRNIYRSGCQRLVWADEKQRDTVAAEKHKRGDAARLARVERLQQNDFLQ